MNDRVQSRRVYQHQINSNVWQQHIRSRRKLGEIMKHKDMPNRGISGDIVKGVNIRLNELVELIENI